MSWKSCRLIFIPALTVIQIVIVGTVLHLNDERYLRHIERRVTGEVGGEIEASAQRKRKNQKWGKMRLQTSLAYLWCSVKAGSVNFSFFLYVTAVICTLFDLLSSSLMSGVMVALSCRGSFRFTWYYGLVAICKTTAFYIYSAGWWKLPMTVSKSWGINLGDMIMNLGRQGSEEHLNKQRCK